ncbi:MAG: hypothetical protein WD940_01870 [Patescibacteria group bacterium]
MNPRKEKTLSGIQYATGWLLLLTFGYGMILPLFVSNLPSIPLLFPVLILTFFTHAILGVRSTTLRYKLWRPWLDWLFLVLWILACGAFIWFVYLR